MSDNLGNFSSVKMSDQPVIGRSMFAAMKAGCAVGREWRRGRVVGQVIERIKKDDNEDLVMRVKNLAANVNFPDYVFKVKDSHGGVHLHAEYMDHDIYTNVYEMQYTRKWKLTPAMTDSEIIQTMFKCCLTSYEHRCREAFKYKGARVFGPHFDVEDLVKLCKDGKEAGGGRK